MSSNTLEKLESLYALPLFELIDQARRVFLLHRPGPEGREVQLCQLLSIKTGGCSEDCAYCAQSSRYNTPVESESLLPVADVLAVARDAKASGATRFCMGAAWKGVREGTKAFDQILEIVRGVHDLGLESCVTLGQLTGEAARQLKSAGLSTYNHNLDTSPEFYPKIVTTHRFEDRLETIRHVQRAGIGVCCGGIIGMGESVRDRLRMLEVLAGFEPPPESVPLNCLMPMPGTPLAEQPVVDVFELVRLIAVARITFPRAKVRLSAGRTQLSREAQALCLLAGANSIFFGEKLLTAGNPDTETDIQLLSDLGLTPQAPVV
jgi:biotin synthase